jgi:hypothetical protein
MRLIRYLATGMLVGMALGAIGCSFDFHNPTATENDVQIVGDSVFDLSGDIQLDLKVKSGKMYKDRSVSGAKIAAIQTQLNTALGRSSLATVIADGGANDILQGSMDCDTDPLTQGCEDVLDYLSTKMMAMMVSMDNKVSPDPNYACAWMGYYHVKGSEIEKNEAIDTAYSDYYPGVFYSGTYAGYPALIGSGFKALLIDTRNLPGWNPANDIKSDDIHPTASGSQKLTDAIWNCMVAANMHRT